MKQLSWIVMIWLMISWGCDPCAECGQPLIYDPNVKLIFINQDSAVKLNDSISINTASITEISKLKTTYKDSITKLKDSLVWLDSAVNIAGDIKYEPIQLKFTNRVDSFILVNKEIDTLVTETKAINKLLNATLSTIKSGKVQIQYAKIAENGAIPDFGDSATSFKIPLLLAETQTSYTLMIDSVSYELSFSYQTQEIIDKARRVYVQVYHLDTIQSSFDSLFIECRTSECISDETTITAYF